VLSESDELIFFRRIDFFFAINFQVFAINFFSLASTRVLSQSTAPSSPYTPLERRLTHGPTRARPRLPRVPRTRTRMPWARTVRQIRRGRAISESNIRVEYLSQKGTDILGTRQRPRRPGPPRPTRPCPASAAAAGAHNVTSCTDCSGLRAGLRPLPAQWSHDGRPAAAAAVGPGLAGGAGGAPPAVGEGGVGRDAAGAAAVSHRQVVRRRRRPAAGGAAQPLHGLAGVLVAGAGAPRQSRGAGAPRQSRGAGAPRQSRGAGAPRQSPMRPGKAQCAQAKPGGPRQSPIWPPVRPD
jgi:hypothetical protein